MTRVRLCLVIACLIAAISAAGAHFRSTAQKQRVAAKADFTDTQSPSEMRPIIEYYVADRGSLQRSFPVATSPARRERFRRFYADMLERIQKLNFDAMSQQGKVD